jgi:hypothetical protein
VRFDGDTEILVSVTAKTGFKEKAEVMRKKKEGTYHERAILYCPRSLRGWRTSALQEFCLEVQAWNLG